MATKTKSTTPAPRTCRVPLASLADVRGELGRVYRSARAGRMPWHDATRASHILSVLARLIEGSEFEARIAELEARLAEREAAARRPNGHDRPELHQ